jgi:hypothetical protein
MHEPTGCAVPTASAPTLYTAPPVYILQALVAFYARNCMQEDRRLISLNKKQFQAYLQLPSFDYENLPLVGGLSVNPFMAFLIVAIFSTVTNIESYQLSAINSLFSCVLMNRNRDSVPIKIQVTV